MSSIAIIGNSAILVGTLRLAGKTYGEVESGSIELTGDEEGIPDSLGSLQAMLLTNDQYKITFTTILPSTLVMPARGDRVDIPDLNLAATLLGWKKTFGNKTAIKLDITCAHWKSIGGAIGAGPTVTTVTDAAAGPAVAVED